jgi:hypothetical protein
MRFLTTACVIAASTVLLTATAANLQPRGEARAYVGTSFGGQKTAKDSGLAWHYGLRMDYRSPYQVLGDRAPLVNMRFDHHGLQTATLGGVRLLQRDLILNADGSSNVAYSPLDWSLLLVGTASLGLVFAQISNGRNTADPATTTTTTGGGGAMTPIPSTRAVPVPSTAVLPI